MKQTAWRLPAGTTVLYVVTDRPSKEEVKVHARSAQEAVEHAYNNGLGIRKTDLKAVRQQNLT